MQEERRRSLKIEADISPTMDVEKRESLLGVIAQSPQAVNAGTGQTPVIVKVRNTPDNPYAQRGFKRGLDEAPTIKKFLRCYSLGAGILFSAFYDALQTLAWFALVFLFLSTISWPFHLIYFFLCLGRLFFFWRYNRKDTEHSRCQLYQAHLATTMALGVVYFLHFLVSFITTGVFPAAIFVWAVLSMSFGAYLILVHRQNWQNFEIDQLRAEAYEQSKIDNSGVICAEDLHLSDGVTHAWANQGGETKVYDPEKSVLSSPSSHSSVDYGAAPNAADVLGNSYISNTSFDQRLARASTGSIDQIMLEGTEGEDKSVSVKYIENQQILEAENCTF